MQCVQCWNEIKREDIRCSTCNEIFCSQKCLDEHVKDVAESLAQGQSDAEYYEQQMDFQDEYREANEPFRYWEKI